MARRASPPRHLLSRRCPVGLQLVHRRLAVRARAGARQGPRGTAHVQRQRPRRASLEPTTRCRGGGRRGTGAPPQAPRRRRRRVPRALRGLPHLDDGHPRQRLRGLRWTREPPRRALRPRGQPPVREGGRRARVRCADATHRTLGPRAPGGAPRLDSPGSAGRRHHQSLVRDLRPARRGARGQLALSR